MTMASVTTEPVSALVPSPSQTLLFRLANLVSRQKNIALGKLRRVKRSRPSSAKYKIESSVGYTGS